MISGDFSLNIWIGPTQGMVGGQSGNVGRGTGELGRATHLSGWQGQYSECLLNAEAVVFGIPSGLSYLGGQEAAEAGERVDLGWWPKSD